MRYNSYLATLGIFCISCASRQNKAITDETVLRPNIIYILCDDMGYGDIKSLNAESLIPTPNMDKIVLEWNSFYRLPYGLSCFYPYTIRYPYWQICMADQIKAGSAVGLFPVTH